MAVGDHSESAFSIFDRLLRLWKKLLSHITLASITDVCRSPLIHFNLRNDITLFLSPKSQYSSSSSTSEYFQLLMSIAPKFTKRRSSFLESHMFVPDLFNHSLFKRNFDILYTSLTIDDYQYHAFWALSYRIIGKGPKLRTSTKSLLPNRVWGVGPKM